MLPRLSLVGGSFVSLSALVAPVRADAPLHALTWAQEVLQGEAPDAIDESPELRTLRLAEEELFGQGPDHAAGAYDDGDNARAAGTPPQRFEHAGRSVDVSFLKELKLPALPVRWDGRVIEYLLFFKDDPRGRELAGAWLRRRERYGPMVRRILGEHALPADLQYVAMIESGYDPLAHSAAEAWGMWQFVKQPAEHYGLRMDHWVDERLDPERSTRAAARFLRDLHDRFGSWELTFAAYNMGYAGLLRAIKKYNTNDYWLLSRLEAGLPFETALYVAKITAMAIVAENPERFGFAKLVPEPSLQLAKVDVPAGTPLEQIAEAAGISCEQLKGVNPHLRQRRTPPGEPSAHVYVPRPAQVRFAQRWSTQRGARPLDYVVRFGESLDEIARRAGTTPQKLRELNALPSDAQVKPGFALLLPAGARPTRDLVEPLVATVPAREFHYEGRRRVFYRVAPDDTAAGVARVFELSVDELATWNSLSTTAALQPGMLLQLFVPRELDLSQAVVYTPDEVRILPLGSDQFFAFHEAQRGRQRVRYRVQPGDTLEALARRFDLSAGSIGRINQFRSDHVLKAGDAIVLYVPEERAGALAERGLIEPLGEARKAPLAARDALARKTKDDEAELKQSAPRAGLGAGGRGAAGEGRERGVPATGAKRELRPLPARPSAPRAQPAVKARAQAATNPL